ncbi:hypothetical protein [Cyanobium sp. ATX-6F1]|uniref:hypothetical protein n=1 Tax=Cyanobium sp. ATX-6F1 TaxID=3137388 RepID=UPI0039BDEF2E
MGQETPARFPALAVPRSARIDGTLAVALQRGSSGAGKALLDLLIEAGVKTTGEVPRWLLRNREIVLRILAS